MEIAAQELFWLWRAFGLASAGTNLADAEFRRKIRGLLEFTDEEKQKINYQETPNPDGTWRFQLDSQAPLERDLTKRQLQKATEVAGEVLPRLSGDDYPVLRSGLINLGWEPPEEETDD